MSAIQTYDPARLRAYLYNGGLGGSGVGGGLGNGIGNGRIQARARKAAAAVAASVAASATTAPGGGSAAPPPPPPPVTPAQTMTAPGGGSAPNVLSTPPLTQVPTLIPSSQTTVTPAPRTPAAALVPKQQPAAPTPNAANCANMIKYADVGAWLRTAEEIPTCDDKENLVENGRCLNQRQKDNLSKTVGEFIQNRLGLRKRFAEWEVLPEHEDDLQKLILQYGKNPVILDKLAPKWRWRWYCNFDPARTGPGKCERFRHNYEAIKAGFRGEYSFDTEKECQDECLSYMPTVDPQTGQLVAAKNDTKDPKTVQAVLNPEVIAVEEQEATKRRLFQKVQKREAATKADEKFNRQRYYAYVPSEDKCVVCNKNPESNAYDTCNALIGPKHNHYSTYDDCDKNKPVERKRIEDEHTAIAASTAARVAAELIAAIPITRFYLKKPANAGDPPTCEAAERVDRKKHFTNSVARQDGFDNEADCTEDITRYMTEVASRPAVAKGKMWAPPTQADTRSWNLHKLENTRIDAYKNQISKNRRDARIAVLDKIRKEVDVINAKKIVVGGKTAAIKRITDAFPQRWFAEIAKYPTDKLEIPCTFDQFDPQIHSEKYASEAKCQSVAKERLDKILEKSLQLGKDMEEFDWQEQERLNGLKLAVDHETFVERKLQKLHEELVAGNEPPARREDIMRKVRKLMKHTFGEEFVNAFNEDTPKPDATATTTPPAGTVVTTQPDGTTLARQPDGTTVTTQPDGTTVTTRPDGTTVTMPPQKTEAQKAFEKLVYMAKQKLDIHLILSQQLFHQPFAKLGLLERASVTALTILILRVKRLYDDKDKPAGVRLTLLLRAATLAYQVAKLREAWEVAEAKYQWKDNPLLRLPQPPTPGSLSEFQADFDAYMAHFENATTDIELNAAKQAADDEMAKAIARYTVGDPAYQKFAEFVPPKDEEPLDKDADLREVYGLFQTNVEEVGGAEMKAMAKSTMKVFGDGNAADALKNALTKRGHTVVV